MFVTGAGRAIGRTNARSSQGKDAYGGLVEYVAKPNANAVWFTIQGRIGPLQCPLVGGDRHVRALPKLDTCSA